MLQCCSSSPAWLYHGHQSARGRDCCFCAPGLRSRLQIFDFCNKPPCASFDLTQSTRSFAFTKAITYPQPWERFPLPHLVSTAACVNVLLPLLAVHLQCLLLVPLLLLSRPNGGCTCWCRCSSGQAHACMCRCVKSKRGFTNVLQCRKERRIK